MKSPKEIFNIVKQYHSLFGTPGSKYMCIAATQARRDGKITLKEEIYFTDMCIALIRAYSSTAGTLAAALYWKGFITTEEVLPNTADAQKIVSIWENFFNQTEEPKNEKP